MTRCVRGFQATAVSARTRVVVRAQMINPSIEKENAKVVTNVKVSEIAKKVKTTNVVDLDSVGM